MVTDSVMPSHPTPTDEGTDASSEAPSPTGDGTRAGASDGDRPVLDARGLHRSFGDLAPARPPPSP